MYRCFSFALEASEVMSKKIFTQIPSNFDAGRIFCTRLLHRLASQATWKILLPRCSAESMQSMRWCSHSGANKRYWKRNPRPERLRQYLPKKKTILRHFPIEWNSRFPNGSSPTLLTRKYTMGGEIQHVSVKCIFNNK